MATFGFPGVFPGGLTTGFLSIGAIQKDNGSSFGFPGAIPGGLTLGYLNIGAVQKEVFVGGPKTVYIDCSQGVNGDGTIGSPYNSVANWISAEKKDLVANTETHTVIFVGSTAAGNVSLTTSDWTTDNTYRIILTVDDADRHQGEYDTGLPRIEAVNGTWGVEANGVHCSVVGLQVKHTSAAFGRGGIRFAATSAGDWVAEKNLIVGVLSGTIQDVGIEIAASATGRGLFRNNIIVDMASASANCIGINLGQNSEGYAYHNTIVDCDGGIRFDGTTEDQFAYNNIISGTTVAYVNDTAITAANVIADYNVMTNASQSNSGANDVLSATIAFASGTNFLLSGTNTDSIISGNNLYSDADMPVVDDVIDTARPSTGDVYAGAHELVTGGSSIVILRRRRM